MKEGWTIKPLGEVGTFQRGGNFLKSDFVDSGFPCIHYGQIHMKFGTATYQHLSCIPADLAHKKAKIAKKGDLIIAITSEDVEGSCKCTAWMGDYDIAIGAHAAIFNHTLNPLYVSYYFKSQYFSKEKANYTHGFKVVEIRPSDIAKIPIPYPSLSEQQRIVGILDAEFEKIDALKANAEKNLQNAKDLFQAALKRELEPKDRWNTSTIGRLCTLKSGNSSANDTPDGELPFVKVGDMNITGNEDCITCSSRYVDYEQNRKGIFPIGSIIFPKRGGAILTNKKRITTVEICCDLNIMGVYSNGDITPEFLYYYFQGINLADLYNGAAIPQINNGDIAPLTINYPALDKQKEVVQKLDNLRSNCKTLQDNHTQTIALCDDLKQALLRKAFSGEL